MSIPPTVAQTEGDEREAPVAPAVPTRSAPDDAALQASNDLLASIRSGDRDAAAKFLMGAEPLIRRRYRSTLGRAVRRLVDSQDLVSTIARRFDAIVRRGHVKAASTGQLMALLFRIGDNAVVDKSRVIARLERVEGPDSDVAYEWRVRLARAERHRADGAEIELDKMLRSLEDSLDRQILSLWLMGREHASIAEELEMDAAAVRKRWERIRIKLKAQGGRRTEP